MQSTPIRHCRICRSGALSVVLDLGAMASCGIFPKAGEPDAPSGPLTLVQCGDCGLVQLQHDYDGAELYRTSYGYRSGLNESMVRHLGGLVTDIGKRVELGPGDIVLDIGSNDGTTLGFYDERLRRIGIDPTVARFRGHYKPGIEAVDDFFNAQSFVRIAGAGAKAKVVTSISMFYDLPDPAAFTRDVAGVLADDGIWVMEQSYLPTMVERNAFDTICHEHLEYYGLQQIEHLARQASLRLLDVRLNDINGGSFQVWLCHRDAAHDSNNAVVDALIARETAEGYRTGAPLAGLAGRIDAIGEEVLGFLRKARERGALVHGYGASTKGNTLLQHFGITADLLPAIAERNQEKFGARTPGTNIPIISEAQSRAQKPDYYFVLPWHFRDGFITRERAFIESGGRFVFPLPAFEIYPRGQ
jgi:hypothetical protein